MSFNKCIFIGRLGADPVMKEFENGMAANFSIAVNSKRTDTSGTKKEYTEWVRLAAYGKTAELVQQYLKKGDYIFVEGSLRSRKYTNKDGVETIITNVHVSIFEKLNNTSKQQEEASEDYSDVPT